MYKNQLQELAQRSCFNLPSYTCIREGPDHTPRFKAVVNFNGDSFESPNYFSTLRQAEHAAEIALSSHSLAARILSCIKVALDFVSPENVGECIRLTEDFRVLPQNHRAKEDKLEVKKMALYAVEAAVKELGNFDTKKGSKSKSEE